MSTPSIFENEPARQADWALAQDVLTECESFGGCYFKREDTYAPLGLGGVNGSKVRMALWWLDRQLERLPELQRVVYAGSINAPVHARIAAVAAHRGLQSLHVLGASKLETALRRPVPKAVHWLGGQFDFQARVAYNNVIQKRAAELVDGVTSIQAPYGLWLGEEQLGPGPVRKFYRLVSEQVENVPREISRVILPAGTFTTALGVFWGFLQRAEEFPFLRSIELPVIGTDHEAWFWKQLGKLLQRDPEYHSKQLNWEVKFWKDLDLSNWDAPAHNVTIGEVQFHPYYEAKIVRWMRKHHPSWLEDRRTCFWLVGGDARVEPMQNCEWRKVACGYQ